MQDYFTLPISFKSLIENKQLGRCNIVSSIAQNINLMLISKYGENRYSPHYGSKIWDYDFENILSTNSWKEEISTSVKETLALIEPRLSNIQVKVESGQEEIILKKSAVYRIKRKVEFTITGFIVTTNEPFSYRERLLVSPLSDD